MSQLSKNKKEQAIYNAAKELFWQLGFKKVVVEDICQKARVSRMTFYKYFKNKSDLALIILKDLFDEVLKKYDNLMACQKSFPEKLTKLFELKLEASKEISIRVIQELYNSDIPEIKDFLNDMLQQNNKRIINFIELGKKEGAINADLSTEFILYQIDNIYNQMHDEKLYKMFSSTKKLTESILDVFFFGIIKSKSA